MNYMYGKLKKLKKIIDKLDEYGLYYDPSWAKNFYKNLNLAEILNHLKNDEYERNYKYMKEYYNNVAQNPPQYYGKNLDDFLELFINEYATDDEIKEGYPRLRKHIFTWLSNKLDSDYHVKTMLETRWKITEEAEARVAAEEAARVAAAEEAAKEYPRGGKRNSKGKSKKVVKKPVVSQKKQSIYKEILGKQMKIYKMPDSRKEYVKYKGELLHISDYKDLMKQKAIAKTKTKVTKVTKVTKETQQNAIAKTKTTKATKAMQQKAKAKAKK